MRIHKISAFKIYALIFSLFIQILFISLTYSEPNNPIPQGFQSYFDRPDIMSVAPQSHSKDLPSTWDNYKRAHLEAIALYLELYPDYDLYFLARDAELLYDLVKLATQDQPEAQSRLHLLNISRANMKAKNVNDYLAQNGISAETLSSGKKVMFIDTGFSGTIPRIITSYFPGHESQFKTHLLTSSNQNHPSTRSFLYYLNQMAADVSPSSLHGTIVSYEHMPRYTDRSNSFYFDGTLWHPISPIGSSKDGQVVPDTALKFQEDLSLFWQNDETKKVFYRRRTLYQWLNQKFKAGNIVDAITKLISIDGPDSTSPDVLMLDLDDTLLKEVPIEFKNHEAVQRIYYRPNPDKYAIYLSRINQSSDPNKVIHYELHGDGTMTAYLTLRPVLQDIMFQLKDQIQVGSLQVLVTSANDPNRTKAVLEQVKINGIPLNELGFKFVEPNVFLDPSGNKDVQRLRQVLNLSEDLRILAVDDLADKVINLHEKDATLKVTPFDLLQVYNLLIPDQVLMSESFNSQDLDLFKKLNQAVLPVNQNFDEVAAIIADIPIGLRLAIAKDFVEVLKRNFSEEVPDIPGLNLIQSKTQQQSKKNDYIKKYPQWSGILENPDDEIPKLFVSENWQMIGNLIDANIDEEINRILIKYLFDAEASGIKKSLQEGMIEQGNQSVLIYLAHPIFSQAYTKNMTDLLKLVIEKGNQMVLKNLAISTFTHPHTESMTDLLRLVIEKGDNTVHINLAKHTFAQPHTASMTDLLRLLIEKGDQSVLRDLAQYTFSQAHSESMTDLLRLVIKKGDHTVQTNLAKHTFAQPHTATMTDLLGLLIEKGDQSVLRHLAQYTFSQPHSESMSDLLRLVIEKGEPSVLVYLAQYTFSKPHTQNMTNLLSYLIERSNQMVLRSLAQYTFSKPHTKDMNNHIKTLIEKGDSEVLKSLAQYTFSAPHTVNMPNLLKLLIEKGEGLVLNFVAANVFSQPHTEYMTDLLKLLIEKGDQPVLRILADSTFSKPHTKNMNDLLTLVIKKGDEWVLKTLAKHTFSEPHSQNKIDLLRLIIEKSEETVLGFLFHETFSQSHMQGPVHQILEQSLKIKDKAKRIEFLRLNLDSQDVETTNLCTRYLGHQ